MRSQVDKTCFMRCNTLLPTLRKKLTPRRLDTRLRRNSSNRFDTYICVITPSEGHERMIKVILTWQNKSVTRATHKDYKTRRHRSRSGKWSRSRHLMQQQPRARVVPRHCTPMQYCLRCQVGIMVSKTMLQEMRNKTDRMRRKRQKKKVRQAYPR